MIRYVFPIFKTPVFDWTKRSAEYPALYKINKVRKVIIS